MEIRIIVNEEIMRCVAEKAMAVGITLEQAITTYLARIAEGTEPLENEFLPDGTLRRRTLRQQIYRFGD